MRRILAISTTTHDSDKSTSVAMLDAVLRTLPHYAPGAEVRAINAADLQPNGSTTR